jgi:WD40 repeat protein
MPGPHDPFSPERVDESLTSLFASESSAQMSMEIEARLVRDMQRLYSLKREQYLDALQRVEQRLIERHVPIDKQTTAPLELGQLRIPGTPTSPGDFSTMKDRRQPVTPPQMRAAWTYPPQRNEVPGGRWQQSGTRTSRFWKRASLLVAALVTLVLIGSMVFVLYTLNPGRISGREGVTVTPSSSPTSRARGPVVYATPSDSNFQHGLAWSPDGKRLAVLNQENVQIWDATTGGHRLTIPASGEPPVNDLMVWAPNGRWLAIVNNSAITIVDAQTGALLRQFSDLSLAASQPVSQGPYLSALFPASGGGVVISGLIWSPDSQLLAVTTVSISASGRHFFILNARTGAVVHGFPETASNWITVASWSSDGTYLAAIVMSAGSQTEEEMAWVWNLSTYQVVFKQTLGSFSPGIIQLGDQLVWQPHSDNLALAEGVGAGWDASSIGLWDVAHHTLIKSYAQANTNLLTWSPDGKYLALVVQEWHVDTTGKPTQVTSEQEVVALDVQNGQRTVVLQPANAIAIAVIAWSPDGKYIATGPDGWPAPIQILSAPV